MAFDDEKERYLSALGKPDNSKKGGVDTQAWPLVNAINGCKDLYTTSSCSGRVSLLRESPNNRKDNVHWYFVSHKETDLITIIKSIKEAKGTVWFKFEGAIFHVVARNEGVANWFLQLARESGFKHSGLMATKKRFIMEIFDSERIEVPIIVDNQLIVPEDFIEHLVDTANKKLSITHDHMKKLESSIKK